MAGDLEIPDYTRCTLEELYDVRRRIDASRVPERAAALEAEIAFREAGGRRSQDEAEERWRPRWFRDPRALGIYMMIAGAWGLAQLHDSGVVTGDVNRALWLLIPVIVYGFLVIAGAMASLRLPGWRWAGLAAWAIQVPSVRIGRLAYSAFAPPAIELKLWPEQGFMANFSPQLHVSFPESQPLYLAVNVVAAAAAGVLLERVAWRRTARRRLEARRSPGGATVGGIHGDHDSPSSSER